VNGEYDTEPVPGLPENLPEGEALLWQGAPSWTAIARHVYHAGAIAFYFAALIAWRLFAAHTDGGNMDIATASALWIAGVGAIALGLVCLIAWLTARTTIYSITSRRVVMRFGIAVPLTVNVPYKIIASAGLNTHRDHTGDIALKLTGTGKIAYFHLWPHARPWHVTATEPMLRCLPDPATVANILTQALRDANPASGRVVAKAASAAQTSAAPAPGHAIGVTA
jgi:Bacterial PH domain